MNEKQQFTIGSFDCSSGFFRAVAVSRLSWAASKAIVPNSSQYRTKLSSVNISCNDILPYSTLLATLSQHHNMIEQAHVA